MSNEKKTGAEVAVALRSNVQLAEVTPLEQSAKLKEVGTMIAQSGMFGSNISSSGGALIAMTMYKENLSPVEFKRRYHMVNNQPSRTVNSLLGDFKLTGGKYKIHVADAKSCKITFTPKDGDEYTCEVVMDEMLKTSIPFGKDGRTLKDGWRNYPDDMLFARCCGKGLRRIAPELMGGIYTMEEQEDIQPVEVTGTVSPSPIAGTEAKNRLKKLQGDKPNAAPKKDKPEAEVVEVEVVDPDKKAKEKAAAEEKAKAELARKRKEKEEQERADAERAEAERRAAEAEAAQAGKGGEGGAEAEDFTICPIPGQMFGKKWSEMETDVVTWAYLKTMEKYPQYVKQGHVDAMKAVLENRGALPEA